MMGHCPISVGMYIDSGLMEALVAVAELACKDTSSHSHMQGHMKPWCTDKVDMMNALLECIQNAARHMNKARDFHTVSHSILK
jgi:hypothetical protein